MKQVIQLHRAGSLKVDEVPPPSLHNAGLLVLNQASLISPGTEKTTVQVAQKSLLGKAMERPEMVRKVLAAIQKDGLKETLKRVFERLDTQGYGWMRLLLRPARRTMDRSETAGAICRKA